MNDDGVVVSMNFGHDFEDVLGKLVIAPTVNAQHAWERLKANPHKYVFAVGYVVHEEEDGVIKKAELMEISMIPKVQGK